MIPPPFSSFIRIEKEPSSFLFFFFSFLPQEGIGRSVPFLLTRKRKKKGGPALPLFLYQ